MNGFLGRVTTPFTFGLFAVSAISGLALFFHLGSNLFHSMHEWLSLLLLVPFFIHVWRNWGAMKGYFRRGSMVVPLVLTLAAAAAFAVPAAMKGQTGSPRAAVMLMTQTPLDALAPVLKTTPDALKASLLQRGYKVTSTADTLASVAAASGAPAIKLLVEVIPPRR
ncbi:DUF4405 domain-containing protein [Rhodomicrobium sp. Az07]|uniref:DUF4405 domain-containing protein n=1 Tax=Rhodomicrobium sp. Az07 TaxID=2839034 RepID=UPI001BEAAF65|nr:DUF4405 domain-containing protein [Rhodomicrobium sp. Az07]MBT3070992.1 DUF4405 domain-containing protein [Rhodomicrobium sp. Az07]